MPKMTPADKALVAALRKNDATATQVAVDDGASVKAKHKMGEWGKLPVLHIAALNDAPTICNGDIDGVADKIRDLAVGRRSKGALPPRLLRGERRADALSGAASPPPSPG